MDGSGDDDGGGDVFGGVGVVGRQRGIGGLRVRRGTAPTGVNRPGRYEVVA
ncbi:hypothetical protein [Streptomyces sp. NRRL S-31]|uniref:hypothetical protein n=1 Tax=Streptomyces sp. NRRL S-31 TaxID=1463898 RepID=UPI000ACC0AE1|nr:hypothetical protein [Streptomyces sp. NRRL S-31]